MPHPVGGELTVTAPLPRDMLAAIDDAGFAAQATPYAEPVAPTRTEATA